MSKIYFMLNGEGYIKIGVSNNPEKRKSSLQSGSVNDFEILHMMPGEYELEKFLHKLFAPYWEKRELFRYEGLLKEFIDKKYYLNSSNNSENISKSEIIENKKRSDFDNNELEKVLLEVRLWDIGFDRDTQDGVNRFTILHAMATNFGFSELKTDKILNELINSGLIYRPKSGHYRAILTKTQREELKREDDGTRKHKREGSISKEEREMIREIPKVIKDLQEEYGGNAPKEILLKDLEVYGIGKNTADSLLNKLKRQGSIYEPKSGYYKVV